MIDERLSKIASEYTPAGFIADMIFPVIKAHQDGQKAYGLLADALVEDRANADPLFVQQFEEGRVMRVLDALFLDWELRMAALLSDTENTPNRISPTRTWVDYAFSDPLEDVMLGVNSVSRKTGYRPNRVLFSGAAWRNFRRNEKVIEKATNPHVTGGGLYPSARQIEDLLGMQVLVGNAWHDAGELGLAMNLTQIWGDHVWVYYAAEDVSFGNCVRNEPDGFPVSVHRAEKDRLRVGYVQSEVILDTRLATMITNVTHLGVKP